MVKDTSMFSSLDATTKKKVYVADDFALEIIGHADIVGHNSHTEKGGESM